MTLDEIYATMAAVDLANPYAKTKEPRDVMALAQVLEHALKDVPYDFANRAIARAVRQGSPLRTASEIAGLWAAETRKALNDAERYLVPPPEVVEGDMSRWKMWTVTARQRVREGASPQEAVAVANEAVGLPAQLESGAPVARQQSQQRLKSMTRGLRVRGQDQA